MISRDSIFLSELFKEMNPRLRRMVESNGIFAESAEEIVHECWETFFSVLDNFEGRSTLQTFIFGILINKIREYRRRTHRTDHQEAFEDISICTIDGWWVNEQFDPYRNLLNRQVGQSIDHCLECLSSSQRAAFLLTEVEGETPECACRILGTSSSNLRVLVSRAKGRLRLCLKEQNTFTPEY